MKKGIFILTGIIWLVLIYLAQILAYALNTLSNTSNKQKIFSDISQLFIPPAKHPISTIIGFVSDKNTVFFVIGVIATIICIYILIKQLFE
ncbi:putative membrane TraJ domain protein, partial [Staphylococcus aureus subsp. aureus CIGC341D]